MERWTNYHLCRSCGGSFQTSKRVVKTCYYTKTGSSGMRKFRTDDVVLLDRLRCSSAEHGGCQKACIDFLARGLAAKSRGCISSQETRRDLQSILHKSIRGGSEQVRARPKTPSGPTTYFCQASELLKATDQLSRWERFTKCFQ